MHVVDKPIQEKTKNEIEKRLDGMGDYVKMSYLQRALGSGLDYDTKKFVTLRLSGIFEARSMFLDAAKMVKSAGEINTTFKEKAKDFMKCVELNIKGGDYNEADRIFAQTLSLVDGKDKGEMKQNFKDYYLTQAKACLNQDKRNYARLIYEKALTLELDIGERSAVQKELLGLYDKLGMVREYYALKKSM